MIPSFDPEDLAKEIERETDRATLSPPFDPSSYARIVEEHVSIAARDTPRSMAVAALAAELGEMEGNETTPVLADVLVEETVDLKSVETIGREMYGCYLASDFPSALVLAERVLEREPEHALAQLVASQCRDRLYAMNDKSGFVLTRSSVLRLKLAELERHASRIDPTSSFVLGHVDGVSDAATVAALTGLPDTEALERLVELLDLGVLEVVNG